MTRAALAASKPGAAACQRDNELEAVKVENARLSETLKAMAVRLTLVEGKGRWGWRGRSALISISRAPSIPAGPVFE
jgi:hypothetical protein